MTEWERDLSQEWDLEEWYDVASRACRGILNDSFIDADLKVITQWYLVPIRLAKFYSSAPPLCFLDCSHIVCMLHILWECLKIRSFWNKILSMVRKVTGIQVTKSLRFIKFPYRKVI